MAIFRARRHGAQLAAVNSYQFPSSVRQRFVQQHGELTEDGVRSVEAAARQWFRLGVRHPKARLVMPSVLVDDLWREFVLHTREYAEFCDAAFGRLPHRTPEPVVTAAGSAENRSIGLRATYLFAQQDEPRQAEPRQAGPRQEEPWPGGPVLLPALFRVDQELAVAGGRHYLIDCGGRGTCYGLKGTTCLQHLGGPGKPAGGGGKWDLKRSTYGGNGVSSADGCGSGCGGGGGD